MSRAIFFAEIFSVEMNEFVSLILNKNIGKTVIQAAASFRTIWVCPFLPVRSIAYPKYFEVLLAY